MICIALTLATLIGVIAAIGFSIAIVSLNLLEINIVDKVKAVVAKVIDVVKLVVSKVVALVKSIVAAIVDLVSPPKPPVA